MWDQKARIAQAENRAFICLLYVSGQQLSTFEMAIQNDQALYLCTGQTEGGTSCRSPRP